MAWDEDRPAFITSPWLALLLLLFIAYDAAWRLWHLAMQPSTRPNWIFPLHAFLPNWAAVVMNVFTYTALTATLVAILRGTRGAERALLAICLAEVLIVPAKGYVPLPVATAIVWGQALGALIMLLAAVQVLLRIRECTRHPRGEATGE